MVVYLINTEDVLVLKNYYENLGFNTKRVNNRSYLVLLPLNNSILLNYLEEKNDEYLNEFYIEIFPNQNTIYIKEKRMDLFKERLIINGVSFEEKLTIFESKLTISDPLGNRIQISQNIEMSENEIINSYYTTGLELCSLLDNLDKKQLDIVSKKTGWTIKTVVNHTVEIDTNNSLLIKYMLAESGRKVHLNTYNCDIWIENIDYENIPFEKTVNYYKYHLEYIVSLLEKQNYPLDNYIIADNNKITLGQLLKSLASHNLDHIDEIKEAISLKI